MAHYFSKSEGGFFNDEVHGSDIPADAVKIKDALYDLLIAAQAEGKTIISNAKGFPSVGEPEAVPVDRVEQSVRIHRDELLKACDWTQVGDVPAAISMKWAIYRQELRDVTHQAGFPLNVVWPEIPA